MKQKVSQATIDKIKKMGMTKALKKASGANPEMKEALTRMYGARRVAAASKPVPMNLREAERRTPMKAKPTVREAERSTPAKGKLTVREAERRTPVKKAATPMRKKSTTTDPFAKAVLGGLGAVGRTLAVKPRPVSEEAKRRAAAKKNK